MKARKAMLLSIRRRLSRLQARVEIAGRRLLQRLRHDRSVERLTIVLIAPPPRENLAHEIQA